MPSSAEYRDYVLDLLSGAQEITTRTMMGEYVLYVDGKVFGGIYDDRFLVKNTPGARALLPEAELALPYEGTAPMLLVDCEDRDRLAELMDVLFAELPVPGAKKKPAKAN